MVRAAIRIVAIGLVAALAAAVLLACEGGAAPTPSTPAATFGTPAEQVPTAAPAGEPILPRDPFEAPTPGQQTVAEGAVASRTGVPSDTWRGIVVAPEHRCAPYDSDDYRYSQSVEQHIVAEMGGIIYGPYTGTWFASTSETDIEHIVARSEAHDSGLCAADAATRRQFAGDLLNLTLASPAVNRSRKSAKDAAEWLPDLNHCWFAGRVVEVRQRYSLTIDPRERDVLEGVLTGCALTSHGRLRLPPGSQSRLRSPSLLREVVTAPSSAMTTTATAASPAPRHAGTASPPSTPVIPHTSTWTTGTAMAWCVNRHGGPDSDVAPYPPRSVGNNVTNLPRRSWAVKPWRAEQTRHPAFRPWAPLWLHVLHGPRRAVMSIT